MSFLQHTERGIRSIYIFFIQSHVQDISVLLPKKQARANSLMMCFEVNRPAVRISLSLVQCVKFYG